MRKKRRMTEVPDAMLSRLGRRSAVRAPLNPTGALRDSADGDLHLLLEGEVPIHLGDG